MSGPSAASANAVAEQILKAAETQRSQSTGVELPAFVPTQHPHRRWNPLLGSHVLCSPHRAQRPWQGAQETPSSDALPEYDPKCYLCPGNERASGGMNDKFEGTFIFENDYAAVKAQDVAPAEDAHPLLVSKPVRGKCYVLIFHPSHNLTLAQLSSPPYSAKTHLLPIVSAWTSIYTTVPKAYPYIRYVQIFENKGTSMGCSNPHPHGQVWSLDYVPEEPAAELENLKKYAEDPANSQSNGPRDKNGKPNMLLTYAHLELSLPGRPRVVANNEHFVAVVPYWAVWPFEILVLPSSRHIPSLAEMTDSERESLAEMLGEVACRYDGLFKCSFPYSMGIHQRPVPKGVTENPEQEALGEYAQFHIHFYPPLLRSATVRKFLVGFEMMGEPQRDLTAEQAADRIRACPTVHYSSPAFSG